MLIDDFLDKVEEWMDRSRKPVPPRTRWGSGRSWASLAAAGRRSISSRRPAIVVFDLVATARRTHLRHGLLFPDGGQSG